MESVVLKDAQDLAVPPVARVNVEMMDVLDRQVLKDHVDHKANKVHVGLLENVVHEDLPGLPDLPDLQER